MTPRACCSHREVREERGDGGVGLQAERNDRAAAGRVGSGAGEESSSSQGRRHHRQEVDAEGRLEGGGVLTPQPILLAKNNSS